MIQNILSKHFDQSREEEATAVMEGKLVFHLIAIVIMTGK